MVGSVLMQRMQQEGDFDLIEPVFFSTSNAGGNAPSFAKNETKLKDATSIEDLKKCEAIISCQGGDYTNEVFPKLRAAGWNGYWIDAASSLRMKDDAVIILDPVNLDVIKNADWVIDLGPEGGKAGGRIIATGTPEELAELPESHTGRYLKHVMERRRKARIGRRVEESPGASASA